MPLTLDAAIAAFGATAKKKLSNASAKGQPEDQLRAPFEHLVGDMAELTGLSRDDVAAVGESSLSELKTRPDYSITVRGALAGFVELKAPGKGADPRRFRDSRDKEQWEKLRSLPNVIYSDGNAFSLWQNGDLVGAVVVLIGDIQASGSSLEAPSNLVGLFEQFFFWEPIPPSNARELAHVSARLCRFLRDEVAEQLGRGSEALTDLATDWRKLLFPEATDERFADGYAQAVTFGLLMARAKEIDLESGLQDVSAELSKSSTLIGAALRLLTDNVENQATLQTSLSTLVRVLEAVDWKKISKGKPEAWLYFYEEFLAVYDNTLRKQTGSYYTPPEVVGAMVRLVDEVLRSDRFGQHAGLASPAVTLADPATGTGTFVLGVLRRIAECVEGDEGAGAVPSALNAALGRLIAFEMQLGPFAVAQLRILAEIVELTGAKPKVPLRMFVTNTLGNPEDDEGWIPGMLAPIAKSRKEANKIKRDEPITVVIGNPPYKEKAKGRGGWVEGQSKEEQKSAPLAEWVPPKQWGVGAHSKHLRNLYVYFWRWATWKVFDHHPKAREGIVCYITVAGFLSGPGFQKMRSYLRRTCDDIWIIDCSPEGHQPEVATRIFQGVQQPICIVLASRSRGSDPDTSATVRFHSLPNGHRDWKFKALARLRLESKVWSECPGEWRAPFLPAASGAWASYPLVEELFAYNGSGVMPGRTWVIAPDVESLEKRWKRLVESGAEEKERLFHPHLRNGKPGDKHSKKVVSKGLDGHEARKCAVADDQGHCIRPMRFGYRSFDRQWLIPDSRLINQPNPKIWEAHSNRQVYVTLLTRVAPSGGPALTVTGLIPDLHHYKGSFGGRVLPLWSDAGAGVANVPPKLLPLLSNRLGIKVQPEDLVAYIAAVAAHSGYSERFANDLTVPGIRVPITADGNTFAEAVVLGREIVWLHTFGERMANAAEGRPLEPPRLPKERRPHIPADGAIAQAPEDMPNTINYDAKKRRLLIGNGFVDGVDPAVWNYAVSGKQVLLQWFSYRKRHRERPIMGDRRAPSPLGDIQVESWPSEYTTELLNVLNVLGWLVDLEPRQAKIVDKICGGPTISVDEMRAEGALDVAVKEIVKQRKAGAEQGPSMFDDLT